MQSLKNQKGSVTVFVLVSCLLFIGCVVCVQIYMQSKQVAIDREYRQIRTNYETDTNSLNDIYDELYEKQQALEEKTNAQQQTSIEQETPSIEENIVQNVE